MSLVAVLLASGFGTRLERSVANDTSGKYTHLKGMPKALVPLANKPLLNYWIDEIDKIKEIKDKYIICNNAHYEYFKSWAKKWGFNENNLLNNGRNNNEERSGALGDLQIVIDKKNLHNEDILVVCTDTLFKNFQLKSFVDHFIHHVKKEEGNLILYYNLEANEDISKRGIVEIGEGGKVTNFWEKPKKGETTSTKACPPLYIYSANGAQLLKVYIKEHNKLEDIDAPGKWLPWLCKHGTIYAKEVEGRFDIGSLDDYIETQKFFEKSHL